MVNNNENINLGRRKYLTAGSALLGGVGIGFAAVPFVYSWLPSAKAKALGAPIDIDVDKVEEGQRVTLEWRGKPIFVIRRSKSNLDTLPSMTEKLRDPDSSVIQQPHYAKNSYRSIKPEIFIVIGICTHLGCVPLYKPKKGEVDSNWVGGFFCPCHGSRFDFAGRVFKGVPAPTNLVVPPHKYLSNNILRIGED
ncbi:MAG: ubiquinol-cytochrome c reductase iron-sulfur subunit [Candidatus Riesia sp.]|nr:ubiquinol-cytochrome c reductase iron-sulfur subunit [Candidatus Riesia sp.]